MAGWSEEGGCAFGIRALRTRGRFPGSSARLSPWAACAHSVPLRLHRTRSGPDYEDGIVTFGWPSGASGAASGAGVRVSAHGWAYPWPWEPPQVRGTTWTAASGFLQAHWVLSGCRRCQAFLARLGFARPSCSLALTGFLPSAAAAGEGSQEPHVLCVSGDPREHSAARLGGRGPPCAIFSPSS